MEREVESGAGPTESEYSGALSEFVAGINDSSARPPAGTGKAEKEPDAPLKFDMGIFDSPMDSPAGLRSKDVHAVETTRFGDKKDFHEVDPNKGTEKLTLEGLGSITMNKDGSMKVDCKDPVTVAKDKHGQTTVTFKNGDRAVFSEGKLQELHRGDERFYRTPPKGKYDW